MKCHVGYTVCLLLTFIAFKDAGDDCLAKPRPRTNQDRLLSFTYAFNRQLRPTFEEKLLVTPANYGRMIRMHGPPETGELAVSVYCTEPDVPNEPCHVTLTRARANMDYTMAQHEGEDDALRYVREIPIVRKDAEIPKRTATAFRDCLRIMIPESGDPLDLHPLTIADDDRIEFWVDESNGAVRKGERAEQPGKRTKALIRMGDLLARYCEAPEPDRPAIIKQIEDDASSILEKR